MVSKVVMSRDAVLHSVAELRKTFEEIDGHYQPFESLEGQPAVSFFTQCYYQTRDYAEQNNLPFSELVHGVKDNSENGAILAVCGNGPNSQRNAAALSHILNNLRFLFSVVEEALSE